MDSMAGISLETSLGEDFGAKCEFCILEDAGFLERFLQRGHGDRAGAKGSLGREKA